VENVKADAINIHDSMFSLNFTNYGSLWALQTAAAGRNDAHTPRFIELLVQFCVIRTVGFFLTRLLVH